VGWTDLDKKIEIALFISFSARHRTENAQIVCAMLSGDFKDFFAAAFE
jgi:hypothetical protein